MQRLVAEAVKGETEEHSSISPGALQAPLPSEFGSERESVVAGFVRLHLDIELRRNLFHLLHGSVVFLG